MICVISVSPKVDSFPKGINNLLASEPLLLVDKLLQRSASSSWNVCSETPGRFAICRAIPVDISPRSQPDRALSALNYGLTPTCNLSQ
jgi:hypothetical protein